MPNDHIGKEALTGFRKRRRDLVNTEWHGGAVDTESLSLLYAPRKELKDIMIIIIRRKVEKLCGKNGPRKNSEAVSELLVRRKNK